MMMENNAIWSEVLGMSWIRCTSQRHSHWPAHYRKAHISLESVHQSRLSEQRFDCIFTWYLQFVHSSHHITGAVLSGKLV
jgi:hypothetical protein